MERVTWTIEREQGFTDDERRRLAILMSQMGGGDQIPNGAIVDMNSIPVSDFNGDIVVIG